MDPTDSHKQNPSYPSTEPIHSQDGGHSANKGVDPTTRALAIGLELAKNAVRSRSLEDLQFILVNDIRSLIPFDRSMLILHLGGESSLAAVHNQTSLEKKAEFVHRVNELAPVLKNVQQGVVLFAGKPPAESLSPDQAKALNEFVSHTGAACVMLIPLAVHDRPIAHLMLEFYGNTVPGQAETGTLINMVPFLSGALIDKWLQEQSRTVRNTYDWAISPDAASKTRSRTNRRLVLLVLFLALAVVALSLPVTLDIGGEAAIAPDYEHFAFVEMDGIIHKVFVKEGDQVSKDQLLAVLESKDIDYKIRQAERMIQSYATETEILRSMGAEDPSKLAESRLSAIKLRRAVLELEYLKWQRGFLEVRAPVEGVILTKRVESLIGKKFNTGEAFCRIAPHDVLIAEVYVKQSDVAYVKEQQAGQMFFDSDPRKPYKLQVSSISPVAESLENIGGIYRVKAKLLERPPSLKPGMQGIAHIETEKASLWFVVTRRIRVRLSRLLLYF